MSAPPLSVRQLEDLLRRVFRGLESEVDLRGLHRAVSEESERRLSGRLVRRTLVAGCVALVLLLLVVLEWSRHPGA